MKIQIKQLKKYLKRADDWLIELFYPPRCPICDEVITVGEIICATCRKKIHLAKEPVCKKCGKPLDDTRQEYCADCSKKTHAFTQGRALWVYEKATRESVYRFKYANRRRYAKVYASETARELGDWIRGKKIQAIVPIPLYPAKKRKRGFNQAEVFAKELGAILDIPVRTDLLARIRDTVPQKGLNDNQRKNNLKKALKSLKNIVQLDYILIVDDIYTTGSTIDAASLVLAEMGAAEIYFCCICIGKGY